MSRYISALFVALSPLAAMSADACRTYIPHADLSVIHQQLPKPLPSDLIAADVQFEDPEGGWAALSKGTRVNVRRIIQGQYSGDAVIVRDRPPAGVRITCYNPIRFDGFGFIIGRPTGWESGVLVLQPVFNSPPARR